MFPFSGLSVLTSPPAFQHGSNRSKMDPITTDFDETHPPLKVDRMRHGPTKPKNGSKMVRFGSADLRTSALG